MTTVQEETFRLLRTLRLTTIFGNPGSTEEPFLQNLPGDFTYVLALQEASSMAMADGYAQATGRPALVNLHTAPGVGNALGNLAAAWHSKTPLIVTAGQQTREMLLLEPWLTNRQATEFPKPYVKWSYEPSRPQDVPASLMRAYAAALQPPSGPVFLSLPMDDWEKPFDGSETPARQIGDRSGPDPEALKRLARTLDDARNPALIVGAGLDRSGGWDVAVALAERLRGPVYGAPATERAAFPEDHPQFMGPLPFAIGPLSEKLAGHDVVLVVGAPVFRYYPYVPGPYLPEGTRLFQVTDDPDEAARAPVGDTLLGDPALTCAALTHLLSSSTRPLPSPMEAMPAPEAQTPMTPDFVFHALAQIKPDEVMIVNESPSNLMAFHKRVKAVRPASFFSIASGGLGWGLPASVGMALAQRQASGRPVVAVIGDGSLHYSIQSLWTAAQHKLPLLILVVKNEEYAILKSFAQEGHTPNVPALDVPSLDSVALAQAYGCTGRRVETPEELPDALRAGLAADGPTVLEIVVSPKVPPLLG